MKQEKWRSKVLWTAIVAQIASILVLTGIIDINQSEVVNQVVGLVLQILTLVGVINNPDSKENW